LREGLGEGMTHAVPEAPAAKPSPDPSRERKGRR
jgi:hypothetical protein